MGLLEKISWRTRRWNCKVTLLNVSLHDTHGCWGIEIGTAAINHRSYSLLSFEFRLPNGADRKVFQVTHWDLFYLRNFMYEWYDNMDDSILWGHEPSIIDNIKYKLCKKLFN
jgi:hypothetical protein